MSIKNKKQKQSIEENTERLEIIPRPHSPGQWQFVNHAGSIAAFCGGRYGKTTGSVARIETKLLEIPGLYWWVGFEWQSASMREAWEQLERFCRQLWEATSRLAIEVGKFHRSLLPDEHIRIADRILEFPNESTIWMRTAANMKAQAGKGVHGLVGDEWSLWDKRVWFEYLEGSLIDHNGWACLIGRPKGEEHWSAQYFHEVQEGKHPSWIAMQFSSYENPYLDPASIDQFKHNFLFDQEYLARILPGVGALVGLKALDDCIVSSRHELTPQDRIDYYAFVDPSGGGSDEFTMSIVHRDANTNKIIQDYIGGEIALKPRDTVARFKKILESYRINRVTGDRYAGEWVAEAFDAEKIWYDISERTKSEIYEEIVPVINQGQVELLDDEIQRTQFLNLVRKARMIDHPPGEHDDRANAGAGATLLAVSTVESKNLNLDFIPNIPVTFARTMPIRNTRRAITRLDFPK